MVEKAEAGSELKQILAQFQLEGAVAAVTAHGSGHIHDTYHVQNTAAASPDYLLQRVNHHVFKNVPALMENIQLVTTHLRHKLGAVAGAEPSKEVLTLVPTNAGPWFYQDQEGNYWRMYLFLENTTSYDIVTSSRQAYEGGRAFGKFQALLADLPVERLHDTIPNFHHVVSRFNLFKRAVEADPVGRVKEVTPEIAFVQDRIEAMSTIYRLGQQGVLPLRVTHNDTKFNNVLLNPEGKAQCVIDLDTVMPGYVAYDFGDAIRTTVNTAPEDEADVSKIHVDLALFEGFARGFLEETGAALSEQEVASLVPGALLLPYIMGLRFLTDYIDGDHYYKIHFAGHNLQRARAQFQLVHQLEACQPQLEDIIEKVVQEVQAIPITAN
ncbi:phosphotransferase enzyme family protein [Rufibacter quisquiliarum]|uniref:Aminoglycoside phosphotransferase domain-containing protein n=1 Tax=Rufibacter quisquiliarum TaxID=1549639 RepID=A0A839GKV6_9BACT|nr:aminoglycoside phosphotransferase family protein [Rufibacter quisquiliarum]MBA9079482.1 hypothetical protein [Rufibacter quisquiliarum]